MIYININIVYKPRPEAWKNITGTKQNQKKTRDTKTLKRQLLNLILFKNF